MFSFLTTDLTKMEENKLNLETAPLNVRELVRDSFKIVSVNAAKKGLFLTQEIDKNVPQSIIGDNSRLCIYKNDISSLISKAKFWLICCRIVSNFRLKAKLNCELERLLKRGFVHSSFRYLIKELEFRNRCNR